MLSFYYLWLWIGALIVRYTLDAVCGTNPFDDPTGAYGENPEWERSSRILLLSVAKETFLLRSGTKDFLHKHLWGPRNFQFVTMAVRGLCQPWISPERHHERPGRLS